MQKGESWDNALCLNIDRIFYADWDELTDKPSPELMTKILHDHRGILKTKKFGI